MLIDSSIAQAYIESSCVDAFRASWLFEHTSVSSDLGRNAFTPPPEDLALRETVRKLERRICKAVAHFVPVNRPIWDALFPDWEAVQPTLDLIVGYPEPYDAVAAHSPDGQAHLIFDLIRWCNYAELDHLDSIIRNLLTHEITHLLIGHRYPAADAALESTDYLTRLDAYTFHEGFAHLLSYQATEIDCVDWHTRSLPRSQQQAVPNCASRLRRRTQTGKSSFLKRRSADRTMKSLPVCAVCCIWQTDGKRRESTA